MAFPRVLAVAERAWHRASWELDWTPGKVFNATTGLVPKDELASDYNGFVSALGCREAFKLEKLGITYRVPPPGASIDSSGILTANSEMPCTDIMFSIDEGDTWIKYSNPVGVGVGKVVFMRSTSSNGVLKSRVVIIDEECNDCGEKEDTQMSNGGNINRDPTIPTTGNGGTSTDVQNPGYSFGTNCGKSLFRTRYFGYLFLFGSWLSHLL
mmetsp:Transcript_5522/g.8281  ORF Transcript_5522/g.8281 Transcript_5522/m.8281 type:complete len:211 (+) Transcript_5522:44-676(+)